MVEQNDPLPVWKSMVLFSWPCGLQDRPKPNGRRKRSQRGRGEELRRRYFPRGQLLFFCGAGGLSGGPLAASGDFQVVHKENAGLGRDVYHGCRGALRGDQTRDR